jgi:hypothetical protein
MTTQNQIMFTRAVRENVGLWINLIGGTGSGKTFSAMRLASGIAGGEPFALIDTENRRGLHYADQFKFDHAELSAPFRPAAYAEAILAADKAGYPVIVIDSGSHVWAGEGGMLDWHEELMDGKGDSYKMAAWIKPKMAHKKMVQKLLQVKAHIILCLRAEEKVEMVKVGNKTEIRAKQSLTSREGWIPICDKNLPFEATVSMLLVADKPGFPHPIKLQEQHKVLFPLDQPITEESGKQLAAWASGSTAKPKEADLATRRAAMIKHFDDQKVTVDRILAVVGKADVEGIGEDEMTTLKTLATDVKSGDKSLLEAFPLIVTESGEHVDTTTGEIIDIHTEPEDTDAGADEALKAADEKGTDSEESNLQALIDSAKDRVKEITKGEARKTTDILNGRRIDSFDMKQIKAFHKELDKIEAA